MDNKITISRRRFLQYLGLGAASLMLPSEVAAQIDLERAMADSKKLLGRVCYYQTIVYEEPNERSKVSDFLKHDMIVPMEKMVIRREANGKPKRWYQLDSNRFVNAGLIQLVEYHPNVSDQPIPEEGCLGEITVPYIDAYLEPYGDKPVRRYYYSSAFWITQRVFDERGIAWYELIDDFNHIVFYIRAYAMRIVTKKELEPISPDLPVEAKRLEVHLQDQRVLAFEKDIPVFETYVSTGIVPGATPLGTFKIWRKRPCQRMVNEPGLDNHYDLPGVPWVSYITPQGVAFHGAYWHGNWGNRMSSGCVNMRSEEAKWLYRWCLPEVPFELNDLKSEEGTLVKIMN